MSENGLGTWISSGQKPLEDRRIELMQVVVAVFRQQSPPDRPFATIRSSQLHEGAGEIPKTCLPELIRSKTEPNCLRNWASFCVTTLSTSIRPKDKPIPRFDVN
uniref:Uncharacterized protein n=1 Tax=Panagrellus redivivus TaxID=6233 RepID=A0A7E4UYL7_PANRE